MLITVCGCEMYVVEVVMCFPRVAMCAVMCQSAHRNLAWEAPNQRGDGRPVERRKTKVFLIEFEDAVLHSDDVDKLVHTLEDGTRRPTRRTCQGTRKGGALARKKIQGESHAKRAAAY